MASASSGATSRNSVDTASALPDYLVRYYAWAYVWPSMVWLFDHQPIINAILLGHYRAIMQHTLRLLRPDTAAKTLLVAAVYGELIPKLARTVDELHVADVVPVQLRAAAQKLATSGQTAHFTRMNAEALGYQDDTFDSALMYLLLHEMPAEARKNTLREALRVLRPGGRLVIAEYGEARQRHPLHRFRAFRSLLTRAEPFLEGFWNEDLTEVVRECGKRLNKIIECEQKVDVFGGFYRVICYRITGPQIG